MGWKRRLEPECFRFRAREGWRDALAGLLRHAGGPVEINESGWVQCEGGG